MPRSCGGCGIELNEENESINLEGMCDSCVNDDEFEDEE